MSRLRSLILLSWILSMTAASAGPVLAVVDEDREPRSDRARSGAASASWRWLGSMGGGGSASVALAQNARGEIAVGDDVGVSWWRDGRRERAALSTVRDLAFDSAGVLWVATSGGLFSWARAGRPTRRRLAGGEAGNRIERIATSSKAMLLATGAGAVWSPDGRIFQPLGHVSTATGVSHVAIRPTPIERGEAHVETAYAGIAEAWFYGDGRLSVVRGLESASGIRVTGVDSTSVALPRAGLGEDRSVVDLVIDPAGHNIHLVFEDSIAWRPIGRALARVGVEPSSVSGRLSASSASSASTLASGWRIVRPGLPPGAVLRGLAFVSGRIYLSTDHGLLSGDRLSGPFRRESSPVGTINCAEVVARARLQVVALCRTGLFVYSQSGAQAGPVPILDGARIVDGPDPHPASPELLPDPPLAEIRRRALVRSGLTVRRADDMRDRLRRRGYWPTVELRFDLDLDYDRDHDADQAFVSGDTRFLVDRSKGEGQSYHAGIEFDWALGEVVYPLETVDLSRELRQVVSLRDDVADEINQLYFERQAIRQSLKSAGAADSIEAERLAWRARELDAGLDAWTGGWISDWRARFAAPPDPRMSTIERADPETIHPE